MVARPSLLGHQMAALVGLDLEALRAEWTRFHATAPPAAFKRDLLLRSLAHRLYTRASGDLDRATAALLGELATASDPAAALARRRTRQIKPGCELLREWNGTMHRVVVLKSGFAWNGEVYASLSSAARAITGTHWNGYRFFGVGGGAARMGLSPHTPTGRTPPGPAAFCKPNNAGGSGRVSRPVGRGASPAREATARAPR